MITEIKPSESSNLRGLFKGFLEDLACFLYPPHCVLCRKPLPDGLRAACDECRDELFSNIKPSLPYCPVCRAFYPDIFDGCRTCAGRKSPGKLYALSEMTASMREYLHAYKYFGRVEISEQFAHKAFELYARAPFIKDIDVIIPVPLHPRKHHYRGYNQAELFAKHLSHLFDIPMNCTALKRKKNTKSQTYLNAIERYANIKGVFQISNNESIKNKRILLVDDIVTTGATLYECSKTLRRAGASQVISLTIGRPTVLGQ
ncbi:MAG: hypothetical protein CO189_08315 [candidate division Zixibacteria bacterium CG_4_9_14_3_um_filter_46_8]|nr:MAG: hypothetical protein CO189_08315 [candidate division Zixibacteria bacterium CG_4_9_14_3_um_filter_46_8]